MNRTISANISGIIFNIEEQAYERLKEYLEAIGRYFSNSQDRTEIMADIESRIAELFSERISDRKEVISMTDVDDIITVMGQPEEYIDEEAELEEPAAAQIQINAGSQEAGSRQKRRIFRDTEDNVLGGVCSGVSKYFDWDPIWMRIFFVLMFLSFGTGLFLYIILWIVIPEAKTTADKLAMQGKDANVENIGKAFNTEKDPNKTGLDELADDIRSIDTEFHANRIKGLFFRFGEFMKGFLNIFGRAIGVGFILAAVGMIILLATVMIGSENFISITDNGVATLSYNDVSDIIFSTETVSSVAFIGILLLIGIPIISFLYTGIKLLFGIKSNIKPLGIALVSAWIVGWILCGFAASSTATEFTNESYLDEEIAIVQPVGDTLYLDILEDTHFSNYFKHHHENSPELIKLEGNKIHLGWPTLDIQKNNADTMFKVFITRESRGPTQKAAIQLLENIDYQIEQDGDVIKFSPFFSLDSKDHFRGQEITVTVLVPEGRAVHLEPRMDRIIYDIDNVTNTRDRHMVGLTWTMGRRGLECIDCDLPDDYYYNSDHDHWHHERDRYRFQNKGLTENQNDSISTVSDTTATTVNTDTVPENN